MEQNMRFELLLDRLAALKILECVLQYVISLWFHGQNIVVSAIKSCIHKGEKTTIFFSKIQI